MKALAFLDLVARATAAAEMASEDTAARLLSAVAERQAGFAQDVLERFSLWRRRLRDRHHLQSLSDHVLKDMGLESSRSGLAEMDASRWRGPSGWTTGR